MILTEIVLKESAKQIFKYSLEFFKKHSGKILSKDHDIYSSLNNHLKKIKNWSSEINFKELQSSKSITNTYIDMEMYVYPRKIRLDENEQINRASFKSIIDVEGNHIILLGQPGAGKTTSMKHLCQTILFDENKLKKFKYPIVVKLRDYNNPIRDKASAGIIFEAVFNILGLSIEVNSNQSETEVVRTKEKLVMYLLENLKVLLIIDGFDELSYKKHREIVIQEIIELSTYLEESQILVTSRTADFPYSIDCTVVYELCPLNDQQIKDFSEKWLVDKYKADLFLKEIKESPYIDTAVRPLTIAHLCAIFERVGKIPDKPKTAYRRIINLLLEEWDEQRNVKRTSKYGGFEIDRKFEFLASMAYHLTTSGKRSVFTTASLENAYFKINEDFDLEKKDSKSVMEELESHTGLFLQAGFDLYEFAHKSLQEYLTAEYIVRLPTIPNQLSVLSLLPNELAIAIAISSNSSLYFSQLVGILIKKDTLNLQFYQTFLNRLVIEKPDFNKNNLVGISALELYSYYLLKNKQNIDQLELFIKDDIIVGFEKLIKSIFRRNTKDIFSKYYNITSEEISSSGFTIYTILKKKRSEITTEYSDIKLSELPMRLLYRETFLSN